MTERERLIELLESAESAVYWNGSDKGFIQKIADHLIANGVTIPVRCDECKHYEEPDEGDYLGVCRAGILAVSKNGEIYPGRGYYCLYGERKNNDRKG